MHNLLKNNRTIFNINLPAIFAFCLLFILVSKNSIAQSNTSASQNDNYTIYQSPPDTIEIEEEDGTISTVIVNKIADTVYETVDVNPEFIGGENAMFNYISQNLKYPEPDKVNKTEGKVVVQFIVNREGRIRNTKILKNTGSDEMGKEAKRVIYNMPKWKPGFKNGKPVAVYFVIPIMFKYK